MSVIPLATAKQFLDVIHGADDGKLQMLLDGAEEEAVQYMNRANFEGPWTGFEPKPDATGAETLPPSVVVGILLLLQGVYQASPEDAEKLRMAGEIKLHPQRVCLGA
ncbi:head-tail connector protein [Bordetella genomosp. 4]|uniref:Phage gp6-like head-tail connector protein n=1 Tax=Bordetella genomosp. 4 TaxID=463044 RepID=A0A261URT3_9BORD|nr:head-tail connector protein [Bordetella genomosp. 4]OZI64614.1 hypothetical protein CAL20_02885 [Bordetella genomosp. 4]